MAQSEKAQSSRSHGLRVGIIGAGWPGESHARGYVEAGGFKIVAVADLIPARRKKVAHIGGAGGAAVREYDNAEALLADREIDVISICLPNHLHAPIAISALKSGRHVCCEKPPTLDAREAKKIDAAAQKAGKVILYSFQRRFGGAEQAARAAILKGYAGEIYHARATWMRTRGVPQGTGWYADKSKSGGGAMIDLGIHMLDLAWHLMGEPKPLSVFATTHARRASPDNSSTDTNATNVEDAGFAILRFEGNKSLELGVSWSLNQPPQQQGVLCRLHGDKAAIDVYTPHGATIYRNFDAKGAASPTALKSPKVAGHAAMMRHFKQCIAGTTKPMIGGPQGVTLMQLIGAIYESAKSGKSVQT